MIQSIIKPKAPTGTGWISLGQPPAFVTNGYEGALWAHTSGLRVISALEVVHDPGDIDKGPEYHISISKRGGRCDSNDARFVLEAFGMLDAEEDNHVPYGIVRNFWRPVAEPLIGHECSCKDEEPAIKEDKGDYIWRGITP